MQESGDVFRGLEGISRRSTRFLLAAATLVFGFLNASIGNAKSQVQSTSAKPTVFEYDVASIKPVKPSPGVQRARPTPDGFTGRNVSLKRLIQVAYGIPPGTDDGRISGGPNWLDSERYDVDARMDTAVADAIQNLSADDRVLTRQNMLQALLADRFKLTVRRETKELSIYVLVVGKNGPKLQESKPDEASANATGASGAREVVSTAHGVSGGAAFQGYTMRQLAQFLSQILEVPVVERTGLKGAYDFTLKYAPSMGAPPPPAGGIANGQATPVVMDVESDADVLMAVQELGLKLESGKGPVEVIVIVNAERPSAN